MRESIWTKFDLIKCINLLEREDRYLSAKSVFDQLGIPVIFHRVERHPGGGVQGCFTSHIEVITEAYNSGAQNVLIFEDDIELGKGLIQSHFDQMFQFMETRNDWDIMFLGWHPIVTSKRTRQTEFPSIWKVHAYGGHAYILSRRMIEKMANKQWEEIPIDVYYAQNENAYAIYPSVFIQRGATSDLVTNFSSSKHMKPFRAFMESWSVNVNYPMNSLITIIVIISLIMIILKFSKKISSASIALVIILTYVLLFMLK